MSLEQKRFFESGRRAERERFVDVLLQHESWLVAQGVPDDNDLVLFVRNLRELVEGWE